MAALSNEINDELVPEEDEQHEQDQVELDLIEYLRNKLVELRSKVSSYGTNIVNARGIQKISSEFEILVFGPARVGKSTLIKQVSGDDSIETSAEMNACTTRTEKHMDKYNIFWWDTPGFENWTIVQAEKFLAAIFCRTANSLGSSQVVQYMFDELRKNGILLLYVITKWPFIPETEQKAIINEAVGLLGGRKRGIYPVKEGGGTRSSKKHFRAYECEPK
ncbi:unnamed protein product, partial [Didymodactylos carnosus]